MVRVALWYSLRNAVSRGVHQGLDLREGRDRGVSSSRRAVREFSEDENHASSWAGDGCEGAGGCRRTGDGGARFPSWSGPSRGSWVLVCQSGALEQEVWAHGLSPWRGERWCPR